MGDHAATYSKEAGPIHVEYEDAATKCAITGADIYGANRRHGRNTNTAALPMGWGLSVVVSDSWGTVAAVPGADPRTTMRYDRAGVSLDRHATYIVAAFLAGAAR